MGLFIPYDDSAQALPSYFKHQLLKMKRGGLIAITGGSGTKMGVGKSWAGLKIGEAIDPNFTVDKVCFKSSDFLKQLEAIETSRIPGQVLILDESELAAPSTSWQSIANETIAHSMMTMRRLRCLVICITPTFGFLDKRLRVLCDMWCYPIRVIESHRIKIYLYVNRVKTDLLGEKIFFSRLRFYDRNIKKVVVAKRFKVGRPNKLLTDAYEEKASKFKSESQAKLLERALREEQKQFSDKSKPNFKDKIEEIMANPAIKERMLENKGRISASQIVYEIPDISLTHANALAKLINDFNKRKTPNV